MGGDGTELRPRRARRRIRGWTYVKVAALLAVAVFVLHAKLLDMPYYWDEIGQFVPAAQDFYDSGALIPHSATPNIHPPGVPMMVAAGWKMAGETVVVSRTVMLLMGALLLVAAFFLMVELCGSIPGLPAFFAVLVLMVSPIVYTQSMMVQLDLPAAAFTCLTLYLFLAERHTAAVVSAIALVMMKETGVALPVVLGIWLAFEQRWRRAAGYMIPVLALAGWVAYVKAQTGYWGGNAEFERYNLLWTMRLSHIGFSLVRRFYFLFAGNMHWVAALGIVAGWRAGLFKRRRWAVAGAFALTHTVMVSVLGGAVLERYMAPVLPLLYCAAAVGFSAWAAKWQWSAYVALTAGLVAGLFVNPLFWPFPFENNLAVASFTSLHQRTAKTIEAEYPGRRVATIWPLSATLANPRLGYVKKRVETVELKTFSAESVSRADPGAYDVFVRFSRDWDPPMNLLHNRVFRFVSRQMLDYEAPVPGEELESKYGLKLAHYYHDGGQWVEIYVK